ncbi:aconitate hydratase AcnA [Yersinia intermedia]|uniref:aconitate hydratase AcnA n=1 Tax=Yersinia intermedia TaxID=631 RepID=UPI0030CBBAAF
MKKQLTGTFDNVNYLDITAIAQSYHCDIKTLPYVHRILLENLCRQQYWGSSVSDMAVRRMLMSEEDGQNDLSLRVNRIILPDSSGLPVLQDLAALRDAVRCHGGDATKVDTHIPLDIIVDHSVQVDNWGKSTALALNLQREFQRNHERYRFLKWAQQAFKGITIYPPGSGIIHQINLEKIAQVVVTSLHAGDTWAYPDFVIGGDSHTPTVNALGVLGWGVGGIDAEFALLGQGYSFPKPQVIGVRLSGHMHPSVLTTDLALLITERLRSLTLAGAIVEYFGPAVVTLTVPERATIANMAPEYGATCGFFAVDEQSINYLRQTGRDPVHIALVEHYCRSNALWHDATAKTPDYSQIIDIDLSEAVPGLSGPRRPQDRLALPAVRADFRQRLTAPLSEGGFGVSDNVQLQQNAGQLRHGSLVLAAITSCANTANPSVILAAGLLARNAVAKGLSVPDWVKTSLAPGSRVVTLYLAQAGLLPSLESLGFHVVGYGCTTCGGKSGPLVDNIVTQIDIGGLVVASILSGNRNFEGRIHKLIRANYIGSPALVVLYALAGRIDIDLEYEPLGQDSQGDLVYAKDIWPHADEIAALLPLAQNAALFHQVYRSNGSHVEVWDQLDAPVGAHFPWDEHSHYLIEPPFFRHPLGIVYLDILCRSLQQARVLAAFDDSLTTDHISPGGEIPQETPAGEYLIRMGIVPTEFNTYVARRCNFEVMVRATFANIRLKNALVPEIEGGITRHFPDGQTMSIYDAAKTYADEAIGSIILAGEEYGTGSSRDWAAKGPALLGVKAVIAKSFERIHRANLVGMGILPLQFLAGEGWRELGLDGSEQFSFNYIRDALDNGADVSVTARSSKGLITFNVKLLVMTEEEKRVIAAGGIPTRALQRFLTANANTINATAH